VPVVATPSTATRCSPSQQGAAKRLKAAEEQLDEVLEAALGDDFDALDDFDAMEEAVPPPRPAGGQEGGCAAKSVPVAMQWSSNHGSQRIVGRCSC